MPFAANFTQYGETHFGAGRQAANDYEATLRAGERWAWALDADPAAPEATLQFEQRIARASAAPFNHSGWPSAILAPLRTLTADSWPIEANSAAPPPVSPACEASVCGPREMRLLVPHGGTELRIGELPVAYAHGAARQRGARAAA